MSYITMPLIGEVGNLGSQIQQYFSMLSIARSNNKQLVFPRSSLSKGYGFKFAKLLNINIDLIDDSELQNFIFVNIDNTKILDERVFYLDPHLNYSFMARFDLYNYWHDKIKAEVDTIEFSEDILKESQQKLQNIKNTNITVSMHIRRGDYLLPQHDLYVKLGPDYYSTALSKIKDINNYQILIFSNDISWCKTNLHSLHNNITYVDGNNDYTDLCMTSLCDHNIIANSSFSWWGAYLNKNKNKKVICPKKYLQDHELANVINEKYYPEDWISI